MPSPTALDPRRGGLAALGCAALLLACDAPEDSDLDDDDAAGEEDDADDEGEEDEFRAHWGVLADHFAIARDGSIAARASGSVEVPLRKNGELQFQGGWVVRGSCGVTFISPRYAITAAHCVSPDNVPSLEEWLVVKTYDVGTAQDWFFYFSGYLEGTFPNYEPLVPVHEIGGYTATPYLCRVAARCGSFGDSSCTTGGDVAMLYCPYRPSDAAWLPVATSDDQSGPVEMYWPHELLVMPTTEPPLGSAEHERWEHYTKLTSDRSQNFHYVGTPLTGLLPLKSIPWPDGTPRRRLGGNWTDLYGCHGTSGSGILQRNAQGNLELLGPTESGSTRWVFDRLCDDPEDLDPGEQGISYTDNSYVRALQTTFSWALQWDRYPIFWNPTWPPVVGPG
jgi:hypothetical protein